MHNEPCKVLIVDDEPWNLEVLESFLEGTGYKITRAANGEEALRVLEEEPVDLVLLDIMMPGIDGYGVCKKIKNQERTRFIPVVMVTSLDSKSARIVAIEDGADDFITKPVDKTELLARVKSLIKVKSLYDELQYKHRKIKELQSLAGVIKYLDSMQLSIEKGQAEDCGQFITGARHLTEKLLSTVQDLLDLDGLYRQS